MKPALGIEDEAPPPQTVRRRRVYFISGFDPNGPRRCYYLYRDEAAKQAAVSGYRLDVSRMAYVKGAPCVHWRAGYADDDGRESVGDIFMLRWDDIARTWMRRGLPATYLLMVRTLWFYLSSGAFVALCRISTLSTSLGLYPVTMMVLYLAVASGLIAGGVWAGAALGAPILGGAVGLIAAYAFMRLTRRIDEATFVYYLLHDFAFNAAHSTGAAPEIEARIDLFVDMVAEDIEAGDCDEVLIVGHSSGSAIAASVAARLAARGVATTGRPVSLLTLGQNIPMLSFLPGAAEMRDDLRLLAVTEAVDWIDISTPADAVSYSLTDAVTASGIRPAPGTQRNPRVYSAKFWSTLSAEEEARLRRRYFRIHLQYLCAFDQPQDYDYFRITAGPRRLPEYFEGRRPSPKLKRGPFIQHRFRD